MKVMLANLPLRKKFMLSYVLIIVVISLTVVGFSTALTTSRLQQETLSMAQQFTHQISNNVDYCASDLEQFAFQMASENIMQTLYRQNRLSRSPAKRTLDAVTLETLISRKLIGYHAITDVYLVTDSGNSFYWEKGNPKISITPDAQTVPMQAAITKAGTAAGNIAWLRNDTGSAVMLAKRVLDMDTLDPLGYLVFTVDMDFFRLDYAQGDSLIEPANIAVLDSGDELVFSSGAEVEALVDAYHQPAEQKRMDKDYLIVLSDGRWHTICFISLSGIRGTIGVFWLYSLAVCLGIAGMSLVLAWVLSRNVTKNIACLSASMQQVETGDLTVQAVVINHDEIGQLTEQFNHMVTTIQQLVQSISDEKLKRQAMEYQVLQAQISPHFLYNTLGSIRCLAQLRNQFDIETALTALINLMKATLNHQGSICPLHVELQCVENYVALQRIRYADAFSIQYEIDADAQQCQVLSFILQPLVENALLHGLLLGHSTTNEIRITGCIQGADRLILTVEDNGVGMSPETIEHVLNGAEPKQRNVTSIGIHNTNERIKYYYGDSYGITIHSTPGSGSTFRLILPCVRRNGDD